MFLFFSFLFFSHSRRGCFIRKQVGPLDSFAHIHETIGSQVQIENGLRDAELMAVVKEALRFAIESRKIEDLNNAITVADDIEGSYP